jgi:hypothetical protein
MRKIVVLSALAVLVAGSLTLWPSPSYSAPKGRAASPPSGKSTATPHRQIYQPGGPGDYMNLKLSTPTVASRKKGKTAARPSEILILKPADKSSPMMKTTPPSSPRPSGNIGGARKAR